MLVSSCLRFPMSFVSCVNVPSNGFEVFGYGWTRFRVRSAGVRYLFRSSLYWASRFLKYDTHLSVCISGRAFLRIKGSRIKDQGSRIKDPAASFLLMQKR